MYDGAAKQKADTLEIADHLPELLEAGTFPVPQKGVSGVVITVRDEANDLLPVVTGKKPAVPAMLYVGCWSARDYIALIGIDSMQTVNAATSRIFFSHKPAADDCSATIVVQDAKGNMSQTQLIVDFRRRK